MAKVKISKKSTRIDMTAMCDVAFLLLSFFIMTSTARLPEPRPVNTPASTVQTKIPDTNIATITVSNDNEVFFGMAGKEQRKKMLRNMANNYPVLKTMNDDPKLVEAFSRIDFFGVDVNQLEALVRLSGSERNRPGLQTGVPYDSLNNQLRDWILSARYAAKEVDNADLNIAIKGDTKTEYPTIKKVIGILQDQRKNNFFLVTTLRGQDF